MKITEQILKSIGFERLKNSSNPIYYTLQIKVKNPSIFDSSISKPQVVIGYTDHQWSLRGEGGDCYPFKKILETIQDLVSAISERSYSLGDYCKRREILLVLKT